MKKNVLRIVSLILCLSMMFTLAFSASALTVGKRTSTSKCGITTCGDKVTGKTTTIKIKNTSSYPIKITFTSISNCKVNRSTGAGLSSWSSITIYGGSTATVKIKTNFGKNGRVMFKAESMMGVSYSYTVTGQNYSTIYRA